MAIGFNSGNNGNGNGNSSSNQETGKAETKAFCPGCGAEQQGAQPCVECMKLAAVSAAVDMMAAYLSDRVRERIKLFDARRNERHPLSYIADAIASTEAKPVDPSTLN